MNPLTRIPDRRRAGFTLLELLVTAMVMGTALVAASWSMSATARTQAIYSGHDTPALVLAREIHELALGLPKAPSGVIGVQSADDIVALDSLIGARFAPPILADGSLAPDLDAWSQHVTLQVFATDDLQTPASLDPADGLPPDGPWLYRLKVEVREGEQTIGTFHWWLNP